MESDAAAARKRKRAADASPEKSKPAPAPSVLPAEFLESDSEDDNDAMDVDQQDGPRTKKPRTIKAAGRAISREAHAAGASRPDQVVGSTVYRTATKKRDERLAPKGSKDSASTKKNMLIRGRQATQQRPVKGGKKGFFVK